MVGKKRNEDPAEGSRETVERELERHKNNGTKTPDRSTGSKEERIRRRAYEIWDREGRPDGEHERHWQQAEKELEGEEGAGQNGDR